MPQVSVIMPAKMRSPQEVEWAIEAIKSVYSQTFTDWELVFVNDHSPPELTDPLIEFLRDTSDDRFIGMKATGEGVVDARNQGAEASRGRMLFPLDADDLLPPSSIETLMSAWTGEGIVYGNTILFGQDFSKVFRSGRYSFDRLLKELIMPVGCLHLKSDWEEIGGWSKEMEDGLEDWEYWIRMGAAGVCGHYVDKVTYKYRRRTGGRLRTMKQRPKNYQKAYARMRSIHADLYNGRRPVGCCDDAKLRPKPTSKVLDTTSRSVSPRTDSDLWVVRYVGHRVARFGTRGAITNEPYIIPGRNQLVQNKRNGTGIDPRDGKIMCKHESFVRVDQ